MGLTFQYLFLKNSKKNKRDGQDIYKRHLKNVITDCKLIWIPISSSRKKYFKQRSISGMITIYIMFQIR